MLMWTRKGVNNGNNQCINPHGVGLPDCSVSGIGACI